MDKPWSEMTDKEKEDYYLRCSKCGGEKDSEGWCANYCIDDNYWTVQSLETPYGDL